MEKLEINATIADDSLTIHFRNNISGITQKLGEIQLKRDEKEEIDSISWCGTAVQRSTDLETEIRDLTTKYDSQSQTLEKLNQQLEDLISAKKTHEETLLQKFRDLLNAKKLKIRDQQRLLAGATVDPNHAAKIQNARSAASNAKSHTPTASRAGKRKAKPDAATATESSEEDDSFEPKAPTQKKKEQELDGNISEQAATPEASDDATEDESDNDDDDDDLDSAPQPSILPTKPQPGSAQDEKPENQEMQTDELPPTRQLPFEKPDIGGGREQVSQPAGAEKSTLHREAGNADDETDDDDDEL